MPDAVKAELLRALGRLVRGLSILFWGLPITLIVYVETARTDWLDFFGPGAFVPALAMGGVLWHGLNQLRHFQKQERIWLQAINRAELFAIINAGLAPFLFWWHRLPFVPFYAVCVVLLAFSSFLLLMQINRVLQRLAAMLPDETLRAETKMFTAFNIMLLLTVFLGLALFFGLEQLDSLPQWIIRVLVILSVQGVWLLLFLTLMPLAMTMALIWKVKEVIFTGIFDAER